MKNRKLSAVITVIAAVLAAALIISVFVPMLSRRSELSRQLEIAQQYLTDLDYESALIAFNKVLEIDPNHVPAYLGIADVYCAVGDYEAALAVLEEGLALTGSEEIAARITQIMAQMSGVDPNAADLTLSDPEIEAAFRSLAGLADDEPFTPIVLAGIGRDIRITPNSIELENNPVFEAPGMIDRLLADPSFIPFINASGLPVFISFWGYEGTAPDITPFSAFNKLSELYLDDLRFPDLEFLRQFKKVSHLSLGLIDGYDLSPLRDLTMEYGFLSVTANEQNTLDTLLSIIAECYPHLWSLWITSEASDISGISALAAHENLWQVSLDMINLADVTPLAPLSQLRNFHLQSNACESIAPLSTLVNLEDLDLRGFSLSQNRPQSGLPDGKMSDISSIAFMPNLRTIYIQDNRVTDISPINGLKQLKSLRLSEGCLADISPLTDLPSLQRIGLDFNQISDISTLANFPTLEDLDIAHNQVTDITALASLPNLRSIRISMNPITDIRALATFPEDTHMTVFDCDVTDWSPVAHVSDVYGRPES